MSEWQWLVCLAAWIIASGVVGVVLLRRSRAMVSSVQRDAAHRMESLRNELRSVERVRDTLEERNARLTQRAFRLERAVRGARAAALSVEIETGMVLWHDGWEQLMAEVRPPAAFGHMSDLLAGDAWDSLSAMLASAGVGEMVHFAATCVDARVACGVRMSLTPDPRVASTPATASGMFGLVPCEDSAAPGR